MLLRLITPFDLHCFSFSGGFFSTLRAGRRRDADYNRALARLLGNSRYAALRQFERSPTSDITYSGNSEAYYGNSETLIGAALTLVSGKLRVVNSESTQKPVAYSSLSDERESQFFRCLTGCEGKETTTKIKWRRVKLTNAAIRFTVLGRRSAAKGVGLSSFRAYFRSSSVSYGEDWQPLIGSPTPRAHPAQLHCHYAGFGVHDCDNLGIQPCSRRAHSTRRSGRRRRTSEEAPGSSDDPVSQLQ